MDIITIAAAIAGAGSVFIFNEISKRKNKALFKLIDAIKKKHLIAFLETDKSVYFRPITKTYKNIGITDKKEIIILTKDSPKPCMDLGGIMIAHGDLYRGITIPAEVRKFAQEKLVDGWKSEDIGRFLQEIEQTPAEVLKEYYKKMKKTRVIPGTEKIITEKGENGKSTEKVIAIPASEVDMQKYDTFICMPSVVKDFIYTGINRVSIHDMIRELVYQRELEKFGQRNWIVIAVAIFLILIAIGFAIRLISGSPGIMEAISGAIGAPARIAP